MLKVGVLNGSGLGVLEGTAAKLVAVGRKQQHLIINYHIRSYSAGWSSHEYH